MKYLVIISSIVLFILSCNLNEDQANEGVGIRVINNSEVHLDSLSFDVSISDNESVKLVYTDLEAGDKSMYQYVDALNYLYYNEEGIYFSNYFVGKTGNDQFLEVGWGFCGTGLYSKTVTEGKYSAIILETDSVNQRMVIDQVAE